jgi:2-furoate---CoA ligase
MLDLGKTLLQSVERRPHALALVDGVLRLTYEQWFERVAALAGGLEALGVRHGERLVSLLQNR